MALMPGDKPKPNEDFFMYANGDWIAANPIPPTESQWGSFNELRDKNRKLLHRILDSLSAITNAPKGSGAQLAGDFFLIPGQAIQQAVKLRPVGVETNAK